MSKDISNQHQQLGPILVTIIGAASWSWEGDIGVALCAAVTSSLCLVATFHIPVPSVCTGSSSWPPPRVLCTVLGTVLYCVVDNCAGLTAELLLAQCSAQLEAELLFCPQLARSGRP